MEWIVTAYCISLILYVHKHKDHHFEVEEMFQAAKNTTCEETTASMQNYGP